MSLKNTFTAFLFLFSLVSQATVPKISFNSNATTATNKIVIGFTGDILIHEDLYRKVIAEKKNDFSILWNKTQSLIEKADITYANMEGPTALGINNKLQNTGDKGFIYDGELYSGTNYLFNYHPQLIEDLKRTGFDIVSTANNHSLDRGAIGIDKTIEELKKRDLLFVGTRLAKSADSFYKIIEKNNIRLAWISCTELLNGFKDKQNQLLRCYEQSNEIVRLIKEIKENNKAHAIIITPHWGVEYQHQPHPDQQKYAHLFLEAGANLIIGSHPHVLQPVEKYITKDQRETFIAYSLGNFVAYQKTLDRQASAFIYIELSVDQNQKSWISNYSYAPTVRSKKEIIPAAERKDVVSHVEKYLGPLN